jgi:D-alanyl-lipoteichoic acid acyltransferase DltB (MBOAT superfamily)
MLFNYIVGSTLNNDQSVKLNINRKIIMIVGVASNLMLLGYYKYFDFFIKNTNSLLNTNFNLLHIILPLGISFFTFTQIAYLVDAYKKEVKELDLLNYALFVTFFPHLIAGPILHHSEMMPQFANLRTKVFNYKNISQGLVLFTIGLMKKVLIADSLAPLVHQGFDISTHLSFIEGWVVVLAYTFQLYFDFSGYTDMALGIGQMFNIKLPQNFNSPYKAKNIQDFWRRWHMTLSRFLRDYVYIPLGGNKFGKFNTYRNLFITFLLGGLWHGASWTFILWGGLHGVGTVLHRLWQNLNIKMPNFAAIGVTFIFINFTWVFFRANDFGASINIFKSLLGFNGFITPQIFHGMIRFKDTISGINWTLYTNAFVVVLFATIIVFMNKNSNEYTHKFRPSIVNAAILGLLFCYILLSMNSASEFLYFNF